jgi:hypothetical protein
MHQYDKVLSYIDYFSTVGEEVGVLLYDPPYTLCLKYHQKLAHMLLKQVNNIKHTKS